LENIFLSISFEASGAKEFPVRRIIKPLLEELNILEGEGLEAVSSGKKV